MQGAQKYGVVNNKTMHQNQGIIRQKCRIKQK
jgi:hypothetical protein